MNTDIEKVFQLLLSCDGANHTLAMQLVKSQGLPNTEEDLLFDFKGMPTQIDKLICLRKLEEQLRNDLTEGQLFWRMYSICDECFDFIKEVSPYEKSIKVFGYTSDQFIGLLVQIEFLTWNDEVLASKLDHINGLDVWDKKRLAIRLLKANRRLGGGYVYSHKPPDKGYLVAIALNSLYPIQYWRTAVDEGFKRFHMNIYYAINT